MMEPTQNFQAKKERVKDGATKLGNDVGRDEQDVIKDGVDLHKKMQLKKAKGSVEERAWLKKDSDVVGLGTIFFID